MPRRKKTNKKLKGNGIIWYIKDKLWSANDWLKKKKIVHNIRDLPFIGNAINATPLGLPLYGLDKLGYGRRKKIYSKKK